MFYRSADGAWVGDLFMSLIHTCELNGANSFDYLTALQKHSADPRAPAGRMAALELPRDARPHAILCCGVIRCSAELAKNDRIEPPRIGLPRCT